jgi:hypothetical protein
VSGLYKTLIKGQILMNANANNILSQAIELQTKLGDAATKLNVPTAPYHIKLERQRQTSATTKQQNEATVLHTMQL